MGHKGLGQEKQKPNGKESPCLNKEPAQRSDLKEKKEDKSEVQKMTQEIRDDNGVSLNNKFSALDLLDV